MGKPRLIIIIRHAQSEGNRDKAIHQNTPDHKVDLTDDGKQQAREAGKKLRSLLREDDSLHFFISPYKRTRQTTEGILETLCSNEPAPSPFQRHHIKVYEEPRLREQDFGNFQPGTDEVERLWRERAAYGHFFYRIPNGESGADVYDRVSSFNGSLWRRFKEDQMASVAVLVTHGLCSRVFLMAWYHYSVEFFEDLRNINHCEFLVMKLARNGKYVLQNQLRRWSDLKRERAARQSISASSPPQHIPIRRWANHSQPTTPRVPYRQNTADLFRDDDDFITNDQSRNTSSSKLNHEMQREGLDATDGNAEAVQQETLTPKNESLLTANLQQLALSNESSKPRSGTKAYLGRDGGGSRSGAASPFEMSDPEDDDDGDEEYDADTPKTTTESLQTTTQGMKVPNGRPNSLARALRGDFDDPTRVLADALGDHSEPEIDQADEEMGTRERERREMARIVAEEVRERTHGGDIY
ncbi:hypothetical protein H2198_006104 [Neophaeococcomyces mojaviensis]|uniref:Uncharacterized protein n=1 Tax=Neophaeococcomyces mojaviensis TaxID=3383035 RepID=A0ACC3A3Q2_9EURO|nr:hypothetical protein H2198_006104 [Knufia sp. JES_112]